MEDLFSILLIRTAIPFGYLIYAVMWLVVSLWAIVTIVRLCWTGRFGSIKLYVASALLFLSAATIYSNMMFDKYLDLNPGFADADIIGTWRDGNSEFTLLETGRTIIDLTDEHRYRLDVENGEGTWQKIYDFNIKISDAQEKPGSKTGLLRVIRFNEKYRIIIDDFDDPDMWDGDLGFKRVDTQKN